MASSMPVEEILLHLGKVIEDSCAMNQQNTEAIRAIAKAFKNSGPANVPQETTIDVLSRSIDTFVPTNTSTFRNWYDKHKEIFEKDGVRLDDAAKTRLLLRKMNQEAYDKYANILLPKEPKDLSFVETVDKLKSIFCETESQFQLRYKCFNAEKSSSEDFLTYGSRINRAYESASFSSISHDQFKCLMFVTGLKSGVDNDVKTRLLSLLEDETRSQTLTIDKLVSESKRLMTIKSDAATISYQSTPTVAAIKKQKSAQPTNKPKSACWGCGEWHYYKTECPWRNRNCNKCGGRGHKSTMCKEQDTFNKGPKKNKGNFRASSVVSNVNNKQATRNRKYVAVAINGHETTLQLDGGSDFTIISRELFKRIDPAKWIKSTITAHSASEHIIKFEAEFKATICLKGNCQEGTVKVSSHPNLNVMGSDFMEKFGLFDIPINSVCFNVSTPTHDWTKEFPELFSDQPGHVTEFQPRIELKENAKEVYKPKRPVPHGVKGLVETELERLINMGIITKVQHSEYAAPIVVVRKPGGKIRICGDYSTGLNDQLESCVYPQPTIEEVFTKLSGSTVFSKVDLSDAFHQIEVHEDSRKLLTINTHKGLYQYNRLPFGIKSAPGIFQQAIDATVADIEGVIAYHDDILMHAKTKQELDDITRTVFNRLQSIGFKLKLSKCEFYKSEIKYLGHIITANQVKPDPEKIAAIQHMQAPTNVSQLRSLLGCMSYHSQYIRGMRKLREPLDELLQKDREFIWSPRCQEAFENFKAILTSDLCLTQYDPSKPIILASDASNAGIGACIIHVFPDGTEKYISCASRSLTPAEQNYSQIEKEGLAIIYGLTKFHRYLFGQEFELRTDHKPLLHIFGSKKGIPLHVANRLQRWALTIMAYQPTLKYVKTQDFGYVDVLSRLMQRFPVDDEEYIIASVEAEIAMILEHTFNNIPVTSSDIINSTKHDNSLQQLKYYIINGWPKRKEEVTDKVTAQFWTFKDLLYIANDIIMMGDRVLVPEKHRKIILDALHKAHPGITRMKSLARSYVFWPGLDKDINDRVQNCLPCANQLKLPVKSDLQSWPIAQKPLERIHIDFAEPHKGESYLLIVDAYSKWPEVYKMNNMSSSSTISRLDEFFSRYGLPELVVSDNGPQFTSTEMQQYLQENGIEHLTTAYYQPHSNGQVERFVDTFKRSMNKLKEGKDKTPLETFLRYYRATPNRNVKDNLSPAEAFLGRKLKIDLDLLRPKPVKKVITNFKQNEAYNQKHGTRQREFAVGDLVFARVYEYNSQKWVPGQVVEKIGSLIYKVRLQTSAKIIRSHINQLRTRHIEVLENVTSQIPLDCLIDLGTIIQDTEPRNETPDTDVGIPVRPFERFQPQQEPRRNPPRNRRPPTRYSP